MALHRLTDAQRALAEEHHHLVYKFLSRYRLAAADYYDIAAIGYLRAVQSYCERESLRRYSFSTIAFRAMYTDVGNVLRHKRNVLSLDAPVAAAGGNVTLGDTVADPADHIATLLNRDEAERLLTCCSPEERQTMWLRAHGYAAKEIAAAARLTEGAIHSRIYRAKQKLRAAHEVSA